MNDLIIGTTCTCGATLTARDDEELYGLIRRHLQTLHERTPRPTSRPARVIWRDGEPEVIAPDEEDAAEHAVVGTA